uniref:Glycosyl transferase family 25 domain-containing protein n=1 Tax=viral metagenome TaxID=1070528 RepID=A0A6C0DQC9_9ZZZZ
MELLQNTFFINLEHRTDRLTHVTDQFAKLGITAERFNAVKTKSGAIGCTISHIKCLELAAQREYEQVFICEDDIAFLDVGQFKDSLTKFHSDTSIQWDFLFISGNNAPPFQQLNDYCVRVTNCRCGTGYIVKKHYYSTLIKNMREGLSNLMREPENKPMYALDMYWNSLQQKDNWYLLIPLTVVQAPCYSDIEQRNVNYQQLMLDLDKKWLFNRR